MNEIDNEKEEFNLDDYLEKLRLENKYNPRKDIKEDSDLWQKVLRRAEQVDNQIYNNLHGLRCVGCQLEINDNQLMLIQGSEINKSEYNEYRKEYLLPYAKEIKSIFEAVMQ